MIPAADSEDCMALGTPKSVLEDIGPSARDRAAEEISISACRLNPVAGPAGDGFVYPLAAGQVGSDAGVR
jgi:hypothetical protein